MSLDRDSVLRPLRAVEGDLAVLRAGVDDAHERSRAVVRGAEGVERSLRRFLRDDPTAPVELRLRALSEDDLPQDELLAELRRRNRLPVELAAALHRLFGASGHITSGADATARDAELAVSVADALEAHLLSLPPDVPLTDPATEPEEILPPPEAEEAKETVRGAIAVPPATWGRSLRIVGIAAGVALLVAAAVLGWRALRGGGEDRLAEGEALLRQGRSAAAAESFQAYAKEHPEEALPRVYLARIFRESGRQADAARELRAALASSPQDHRVHTELGYLLLDSARPGDAARSFREAVRLEPESSLAWAGLVRAFRLSGQPAAAERALLTAPDEVRALLAREAAPPAPPVPDPALDTAGLYDTIAVP